MVVIRKAVKMTTVVDVMMLFVQDDSPACQELVVGVEVSLTTCI